METEKQINTRELQHNLAIYIKMATYQPITVSKHGETKVMLLNPNLYNITKKKLKRNKDIMKSKFIGLNKDNPFNPSKLRERAWYGK